MQRLSFIASAIASSAEDRPKTIVQKSDGFATIWLNSLKDLNCLSVAMTTSLKSALSSLDSDSEVKIILIRSKHSKVFCAGADIKHMKQNSYADYPHSQHFPSLERAFKNVRKPIVSVVEGKALGGGFELSLMTDIIVASPSAAFGLPEITLGLIPGIGGTQFLTRIVGTKKANQMIFTGSTISAEEAQRLNIAYLMPQASFDADLNKFVDSLVNKASSSLEAAKRAIKFADETTLEQGLEHETSIFQGLFTKDGPAEGIAAFIEKRKPNFKNL